MSSSDVSNWRREEKRWRDGKCDENLKLASQTTQGPLGLTGTLLWLPPWRAAEPCSGLAQSLGLTGG